MMVVKVGGTPPNRSFETEGLRRELGGTSGLSTGVQRELERLERRLLAYERCAHAVGEATGTHVMAVERAAEHLAHWQERHRAGPKWVSTGVEGLEAQLGGGREAQWHRVRCWGWLADSGPAMERLVDVVLAPRGLRRAGKWSYAGNGSWEAPVLPRMPGDEP